MMLRNMEDLRETQVENHSTVREKRPKHLYKVKLLNIHESGAFYEGEWVG